MISPTLYSFDELRKEQSFFKEESKSLSLVDLTIMGTRLGLVLELKFREDEFIRDDPRVIMFIAWLEMR